MRTTIGVGVGVGVGEGVEVGGNNECFFVVRCTMCSSHVFV